MSKRLQLVARDAEDLEVVSAVLQDALVAVDEIDWAPQERRFVMVANRFRWEGTPEVDEGGRIHERVHCGICFQQVRLARRRGFDPRRAGMLLELLAISVAEAGDDGFVVDLMLAGGAGIRLEVDAVDCQVSDLDAPWPTRVRPSHALDDGPKGGAP